jgi:hypothetical protein
MIGITVRDYYMGNVLPVCLRNQAGEVKQRKILPRVDGNFGCTLFDKKCIVEKMPDLHGLHSDSMQTPYGGSGR